MHRQLGLLAGAVLATAITGMADLSFAQEPDRGEIVRTGAEVRALLAARASALRTSAGPDPDTVWVGTSSTNHTGVNKPLRSDTPGLVGVRGVGFRSRYCQYRSAQSFLRPSDDP